MFCLCFQDLERQKHTCTVLQHKQEELKEGIRQRDELIEVLLNLKLFFQPSVDVSVLAAEDVRKLLR